MLFISYDIGAMKTRIVPQATYLAVNAISNADAYQGRQTSRITRSLPKRGNENGFSHILAEEEDAILKAVG